MPRSIFADIIVNITADSFTIRLDIFFYPLTTLLIIYAYKFCGYTFFEVTFRNRKYLRLSGVSQNSLFFYSFP